MRPWNRYLRSGEVKFLEDLSFGALHQERADEARRVPVVALRVLRFDGLVECRCSGDGVALLVIDDLSVDKIACPKHVQAQAALVLVGDALPPATKGVS